MDERRVAATARSEGNGESDSLNGCLVIHSGRSRRRVRLGDGNCERVSGLVAVGCPGQGRQD